MSEAVFDSYRAGRALEGRLADDDVIRQVARDAVTRGYWVLTRRELIVMKGDDISVRIPLDRLQGHLRDGAGGIDVRLQAAGDPGVVIGTFARPNKLTSRLLEVLRDNAPDAV